MDFIRRADEAGSLKDIIVEADGTGCRSEPLGQIAPQPGCSLAGR
ncbi:hypothetical protein [Bradyrhizobium sp. USDA 4451]